MSNLLIVIPAYNEEKSIGRVVDELITGYPQFDYLIVNDGSGDQTGDICRKKGYRILDLPVNLGLAGAFQAGLKYAYEKGYEYAVQFDGDGQHLACYLAPMLEKMQEGYDIVIGSRFLTEKKPGSLRMMGSNLIQLALKLTTGAEIHDPTSGMRMFNRRLIREFSRGVNYGPEPDTLSYLIKNGAKVAEVQVSMKERLQGASYLTPVNAIKYMVRMLISIFLIQSFRKRNKEV